MTRSIPSGEVFLGVVCALQNVDVAVQVFFGDGDILSTCFPMAAFNAPPQVDDEFDCWLEDGLIQVRVINNPGAQQRDGLGLNESEIEALAKDLDV